MQRQKPNIEVGTLAQAIVFKTEDGYFFCTHDGDLVGPHVLRDDAVTKATLYLAAHKSKQEAALGVLANV